MITPRPRDLPVYNEEVLKRIERDRVKNGPLWDAVNTPRTLKWLREVRNRIQEDELNVINHIYGEPGQGKSYLGMFQMEIMYRYAGKKIDPDAMIEHIFFDRTDFLIALETSDRNDVFLLDEDEKKFGVGSRTMTDLVNNVARIIRKDQLHIIFINPEPTYYGQFYTFESLLVWKNIKKTTSIMYRKDPTTDNFLHPIGYFTSGMPNLDLIQLYELKKKKFLKKAKKRQERGRSKDWDRAAKLLIEKPEFREAQTKRRKLRIAYETFGNYFNNDDYKFIMDKAEELLPPMPKKIGSLGSL